MQNYTMEELKSVIGGNIVALRRKAGMTQSVLAEKLNYSDKAVSKWECGDAIPDILILTRIASLFGVTVDYLLEASHAEPIPEKPRKRKRTYITVLAAIFVWLVATGVFAFTSITLPEVSYMWMAFIYAVPVSSLVVFILSCVWGHRVPHYLFLSFLLWSSIVATFLSLLIFCEFGSAWMLFLIGIPGQIIICLWPAMRANRSGEKRSDRKNEKKKD